MGASGLRTASRNAGKKISNMPRRQHISDVAITRTGKPIIRVQGGRNFDFDDVHVEGAERIAEAVAKYDVDRFAKGEAVVRSIFPETTIVRPAPMFGFEDRLLHKLAGITNILTANHMQERYWPVHVTDVGQALEKMCHDDSTASQTYELYGPKNYSTAEIAELVDREIIKHRRHINIPKAILKPVAEILNKTLWWPTLSADEVEREFIDQKIDPTAKTFKDLGIEPADLSSLTFHYLQGYRSSSFYDLPPATEREKREEKKVLSSTALDALREFYSDRDARLKAFEDLKAAAEDEAGAAETANRAPLTMEAFAENWNDSQFWYSDETAKTLADELLRDVDSSTSIAVVSAPSVFVQLKNALQGKAAGQRPKIYLLEFDERFTVFGEEFIFYDFNNPFKLPPAMTVRWLSKLWGGVRANGKDAGAGAADTVRSPRLILCTGERMESLVTKLYRPQGLQTTTFLPVHSKGLSNEFYCYANFECNAWKWRSI
ncbi:hypothetical protein DH86_00003825 [Scytalidium sp. 3C]|nr:hypothetical protein DH86_00003825 [Scytalidium sp. 3C]